MTGRSRLFEELRRSQDQATSAPVAEARERLFGAPPPRRYPWGPVLAGGMLGALVIAAGVWRSVEPPAAIYAVSGTEGALPSAWISVPAEAPLPLEFSDGTVVVAAPGARTRVLSTTHRGGRLAVERGKISVSVPPARGADWSFEVGPFTVLVTGTRFDVAWDAPAEVFEIEMRDGSVKVSGPTIVGLTTVGAGQRLRIALAPEAASPREAAPASATPGPAPLPEARPAPALPKPPRPARSAPRWPDLLRAGRYQEGLALVPDLERECRAASAQDALLLADAARYAGRKPESERAHRIVRERFPGAPEAALAAFGLGRLRFEAGDDEVAVRWFELYLAESPGGLLEPEALGRILEARIKSGELEDARKVARRYLARFPAGPQAAAARQLLEPGR